MDTKQQDSTTSKDPTDGTWRLPKITYKYEDFTPAHEWRTGEGSDILLLALPGFTRKQIETSIDPTGIITVSGSLFAGKGTYSRFKSEFRIPEDCSRNGIRTRFDDDSGILCITIPKKNPFRRKTPKEEPKVTSAQAQSESPQSLLPFTPSESQQQPHIPQKDKNQPAVPQHLGGATDKTKEPSASVGTTEEMEQLRKEGLENRASKTAALTGAIIGELKLESFIKIAREKLSKERQTLLNMGAGAAVLVTAGLGIYICCKIGRKIISK